MPRGCQSLRRKRFPIKHLDKKSRNFNLRSPALAHPGAPRRHKPEWTAGAGPCPRLPHLPAHCRWHTDLHCASARWLALRSTSLRLPPPTLPRSAIVAGSSVTTQLRAGCLRPPSTAPESLARTLLAAWYTGLTAREAGSGWGPSTRRLNVGSVARSLRGNLLYRGSLTFTTRLEAGLIFSVAANLDGHDLPKTSLGLHR